MEIKVFSNFEAFSKGLKPLFCARVECRDTLSFNSAYDVFKSIYGSDALVLFVCI